MSMHPLHGQRPVPLYELYNYSFELPFENTFNEKLWTEWFRNNWFHSIWLSFVYILAIYAGRKFMSSRPAFDLQKPLIYWNSATALFSLFGAVRMSPEFMFVGWRFGFHYSVCTSGYTQLRVTGFWATLFTLSKGVELIDTAFIVLRKRPLLFLHWYHHITVMLLTWYGYKEHAAPARWFVWMNFNIHTVMYAYYALRALGWRLAKWVSASITGLQITQMLAGCYITFHVYKTKARGEFCQQSERHLIFSIIIYASYLLLFVQFFYNAYLKNGKKRPLDTIQSERKKIA